MLSCRVQYGAPVVQYIQHVIMVHSQTVFVLPSTMNKVEHVLFYGNC